MAGVEQPTNPGVSREPYSGEQAQIEEQQAGAPVGPEQRGRPANPPNLAVPPPPAANVNRGSVSEVMPPREMPPVSMYARPSTIQEQVGQAILGLGTITPDARRLALALIGFGQQNVVPEVMPRRSRLMNPVMAASPEPVPEETAPSTAEVAGAAAVQEAPPEAPPEDQPVEPEPVPEETVA